MSKFKNEIKGIILAGFKTGISSKDIKVFESRLGLFAVKVGIPENKLKVRFYMKKAGFERVEEKQIPENLKHYDGVYFYKNHEK